MLIFKCFSIQVGNFISYGVCKLAYKPPLKRVTPHGVGRCPQGRGDRSVRGGPAKLVEGFFSLYSSQPISQGVTLLFFFTEKKKRSKKRKELAYPCTVWQCVARRLHKELRHSTTLRCMSSITKLPARFRAGSFVFCRLYASEFFCEGTAYKLVSHAGIYSWCRIYKS